METSCSSFNLQTKVKNTYYSPLNISKSNNFLISSKYCLLNYTNFKIHSNISFSGNKLFFNYDNFIMYLKKDFILNENLNANLWVFNINERSNIKCDQHRVYSGDYSIQSKSSISNIFKYNDSSFTNKIDTIDYTLNTQKLNIFVNNLFEITSNPVIISGNVISFHPLSLFSLKGNEINLKIPNNDEIITINSLSTNTISFISNNNMNLKTGLSSYLTENMNANIKNLNYNANDFYLKINTNLPLNLKSNIVIQNNVSGIIQGFNQIYTSNNLNIKASNLTTNFNTMLLDSKNIDINNQKLSTIQTNFLFLSGNVSIQADLKVYSNNINLNSNNSTFINHNKIFISLKNNAQFEANKIGFTNKISNFKSNLFNYKWLSSNIQSNISILSNSILHTNLQYFDISSNNSNISSHLLNFNTPFLAIVNKNNISSNNDLFNLDAKFIQFLSNVHCQQIAQRFKISNDTAALITSNVVDISSDYLLINGNTLDIFINRQLTFFSNKSHFMSNNYNISGNQIGCNIMEKLKLDTQCSNIGAESTQLFLGNTQLIQRDSFVSNYTNVHLKSTNLNFETNEKIHTTVNFTLNNPIKMDFNNNIVLINANTGFITNQNTTFKGTQSNLFLNNVIISSSRMSNISSKNLLFVSNEVNIKGNQIKINAPVLFNSNNFIFNKGKGLFLNNDHIRFSGNELSINGLFQTNINYSTPLKISGNANIQLSMVANANNTETSIKTDALHFNFGNTGTINSNNFILKTDDLSYNIGSNNSICSNSISIQSNLKGMLNTFDVSGNVLSLTSDSIQTFTSDFANQADAFDLISNTAKLDTPQSFVWKGTNLNAAVDTVQQKSANSSLNLNNGFFKSNSSIDASSLQQSGITSNSFQIANRNGVSIGSASLNINLENKNKSTILLNQLNMLTNEISMTSGNLVISESNDIRFNSNQTSKIVSKQSNISVNVLRLIQNELIFNNPTAVGVASFEKANIDSNIILIQHNELQLKSQFSKSQFENCNINATVLKVSEGTFDITNSNCKISSSSNLGIESAERFNISGKNLISKSSNYITFGTNYSNLNSKNEFGLESNQYMNKCGNADFQLAQLALNANKMDINSNQISLKQNKMTLLSGKNQWSANRLNISGNITLSSNNILLNSNKMRYSCDNFNLTNSYNANIRSKSSADLQFGGNLQIIANQFVLSGVLSVFDVYYFYLKKDLRIKKTIYSSGLVPIGNKLDMINGEIFNISNGFYLKKSNIGYNGSFNNLNVNIGTDSCTLNIQGVINYINDPNYEIDSKYFFLNSNTKGSGTARGAGFYIKDNNNINQSYLLVNSDDGSGYKFKSPESEKILQLNFPSFIKSGFVKSQQQGTNPIYNLLPEAIELNNVVQLESRLNNQLNLSGGVMTGNIMMGNNKITSAYNVENANDLTNQTYVITKLSLSGGTMNGDIIMNNNKIKSSYEAVSSSDLVNKQYYDVNKLPLSGGIMSGNIIMGGNSKISSNYNASANADLTNKKYLFDNKLPFSGGTMVGNIIMGDTFKITSNFLAAGNADLTSKEFVDKTTFKLAGGIMQGNINSGLNKITSNFYPAVNSDLTNKLYLNDKLFPLSGGSLSGNIDMGIYKITSNFLANANSEITNKKFLDNTILAFSGGTMTGNIIMGNTFKITCNFSAIANADLTNKEFVDLNLMPLVGGSMKGNITMNGDNTKITSNFYANANSDLTNKKYVDDTTYPLSGGMMNGNIIMSALFKLTSNYTPVGNSDITNKKHLDNNQLALAGGIMNGNIFMGNNRITSNFVAVANSDLTSKSFVDLRFLKLSGGGTMNGSIRMGENTKITSKIVPSALFDLTNKQFVDTKCNISGSDPITGNLTLKSNLILESQYSNIMSKSGNIFFTGNVSMLSNVYYGKNLSTQFLPVASSLQTPYQDNQLVNKMYMDTKAVLSDGITTNVLIIGNLILNNGFITNRNNKLTLNANKIVLLPNQPIFVNNIFSNNSILEIGASDKNLRILGAINKGSLLVGNSTATFGFSVGSNTNVLKARDNTIIWDMQLPIIPVPQAGGTITQYPVLCPNTGNHQTLFKSNVLFKNDTLQSANLLISNALICAASLPNQPNQLITKKSFLTIMSNSLNVVQITNTVPAFPNYYLTLTANIGSSLLQIQNNSSVLFQSITSTIIRMDTIKVGDPVSLSVNNSSIFKINDTIVLTYNPNNIIQGIVFSNANNILGITVSKVQTDFSSISILDTTALNQQTSVQTNFNPESFLKTSTILGANSSTSFTYILCDSNGNNFGNTPPAYANFIQIINNNSIQFVADSSAVQIFTNNNNIIYYTIKASINVLNYVLINLTITRDPSTGKYNFQFSNNNTKLSADISWNLPQSPISLPDVYPYDYIFFLKSNYVITNVSLFVVGASSTSILTALDYNVGLYVLPDNTNLKASGLSSIKSTTSLSQLSNQSVFNCVNNVPQNNISFILQPSGQFQVQITPTQTATVASWRFQFRSITNGKFLIAKISGYPIDYTFGTIRLNASNIQPDITYSANSSTLFTNSISTLFIPSVSNSIIPTTSNQLIPKSYFDNQIKGNVSALKLTSSSGGLTRYLPFLQNTRLFSSPNLQFQEGTNKIIGLISSVQWGNITPRVLKTPYNSGILTPALIPPGLNQTLLYGNSSNLSCNDFLGIGQNITPQYPLHITSTASSGGASIFSAAQVNAPNPSFDLCCSADGQYVYRGALGIPSCSNNYGSTWTNPSGFNSGEWYIGCDPTGQFVFAVSWGGTTAFSNNWGQNFTFNTQPGTWSMSGAFVRVVAGFAWCFSCTYGTGDGNSNWGGYVNIYRNGTYFNRAQFVNGDEVFFYPNGHTLIAGSDDLSVMYFATGPFTSGKLIQTNFIVVNTGIFVYGYFQNLQYIYLPPYLGIHSVDCSSNGRIVYVLTFTGLFYKSTDGGSTFTFFSLTGNSSSIPYYGADGQQRTINSWGYFPNPTPGIDPRIFCVSCNSSGSCVMVGTMGYQSSIWGGPGLFYSTNGGSTWSFIQNSNDIGYYAVSVAKNGNAPSYAIQSQGSNISIITPATVNPSILASASVSSSSQIYVSDIRIKTNIHGIEEKEILNVRLLKTKKYNLIANNQKQIGFIAQDVEKIYPNAISKMSQIIPNIMKQVFVQPTNDLKTQYPEKNIFLVSSISSIHLIGYIPFLKNQKKKIQLQDEQKRTFVVLTVHIQNIKSFYIEANADFVPGNYLLVGQEIYDFKYLNIDHIITIGFASAQMIDQKSQENKKRISQLENAVLELEKLIEKQDVLISSLA